MYLKDHLEKLNYFYEVAKRGSIKEASAALNITQPSVTKSIKILESALDTKLFNRLPRGVSLTVQGTLLKNYCHVLFAQLEDVEKKLLSPDDPISGSIRVGTYDSIAIYFWPQFLKKFIKKYPNLDIDLTTDRSFKVQKMVESGEIDLALIIEPSKSSTLQVDMITDDNFQLYVSSQFKKDNLNFDESPLIFMPDALAGKKQGRLSHSFHFQSHFKKQFKTSSLESAKELILSGLGTGLLPKMVAKDALAKKKIHQIKLKDFPKEGVGSHSIGLVYPKKYIHSKTLQLLIKEIKNHGLN